jgi:uncharacterized membrane protein
MGHRPHHPGRAAGGHHRAQRRRQVHADIEFAGQEDLYIGPYNLGPQSLWVMGGLCLLNLAFVLLGYKELKLATFDAGLAASLGLAPALLHTALMTVVSITAVGAFAAVGAILTVALFIVPPATAYLLTDRLPVMIGLGAALGALAAAGAARRAGRRAHLPDERARDPDGHWPGPGPGGGGRRVGNTIPARPAAPADCFGLFSLGLPAGSGRLPRSPGALRAALLRAAGAAAIVAAR